MVDTFLALRDAGRFEEAAHVLKTHCDDPSYDVWIGLDTFHDLVNYEVNLRTSAIRRKDGRFGCGIKTRLEKHGKYHVCTLRTSSGPKVVFVHRLLLHAFQGGGTAEKNTVDHIDGTPCHNVVWNLRYASSQDQNRNRPNRPRTYARRVPFDMEKDVLPGEEFRRFPESTILVSNKGRIVYEHGSMHKIRSGPEQLSKGYPVINVKGRFLACHRLVAHLFLGLDLVADTRVVMHLRPHSTLDYSLENLKLGSLSENALASAGDNTRRIIPVHVYQDAIHRATYTSIAATSRATGVNTGRISKLLKTPQKAWSPILNAWCTFAEDSTARRALDALRSSEMLHAREAVEAQRRRNQMVVGQDPVTGHSMEFETIQKAASFVNRHSTSINTAIRNSGKSRCAGLVWRLISKASTNSLVRHSALGL